MRELIVKHNGVATDRDRYLSSCVDRIFRACVLGRSIDYVSIDSASSDQPHATFTYSGEPEDGDFDFVAGSKTKFSMDRQPCMLDVALVLAEKPVDLKPKLAKLDDGTMGWLVLTEDGIDAGDSRIVTESKLIQDVGILDKASHVLSISKSGGPLATTKLMVTKGCVVFSSGWRNVDSSAFTRTSGIDDFLMQAEVMSNNTNSRTHFMANVAPSALTMDHFTARNFRSLIGSALKNRHGTDFGILNLTLADQRLMER